MDRVPSLSVSIASKFLAAFLLNFFASLRSRVPSLSLSAFLKAAAVLSWSCMLLSLVFLSCLASLLVSFIASLVLGSDYLDCEVSACLGAALTSVSAVLSAANTMVAVPANNPATNSEMRERFMAMILSGRKSKIRGRPSNVRGTAFLGYVWHIYADHPVCEKLTAIAVCAA